MRAIDQPSEPIPGGAVDWVQAPDYDRVRRALELRRVLVVEDDRIIRDLNRRVLERSGFRVSIAEDGLCGWEALRSRHFDLLITDHDMPRMTGAQLVGRLRKARMDLPVILASGNPDLGEGFPQSVLRLAAVLLKPFSPRRLIETVKRVLRTEVDAAVRPRARDGAGGGPAFRFGPACAQLGLMREEPCGVRAGGRAAVAGDFWSEDRG
jgi:DNA-binding response OmpR family regulator